MRHFLSVKRLHLLMGAFMFDFAMAADGHSMTLR
jgi:hypothetical protein